MRKANVDVYHEDSTVQMPDTPTFSSFQTGLVYGSNTRPLDPIIELQTKNGNSSYYFNKIKKKKKKNNNNRNRPGRRKGQRVVTMVSHALISHDMCIMSRWIFKRTT